MNLKGRVILISGGGTGIGKATALLCARYGAHVIVCGRRREFLSDTASLVRKSNGEATVMPVDVNNWREITEVVRTVVDRFGKIDVLVNSAGIAIMKPMVSTSMDEWDTILNTNLRGTFLFCIAVLPEMMKVRRGVIVNISSILGKTGIANMAAYCSSKFGVLGLTQSLAEETRPYGINVYAVCPGPTNTPLHSSIVGTENTGSAMSPDRVAEKIVALVTGKIALPSGGDIVIDENAQAEVVSISMRYMRRVRSMVNHIKRVLSKLS